MSAPWFRTSDFTRWGAANSGGDLSAVQFDENNWYFYSAIVSLTARPIPVNIDHFELVGNQLTAVMEDHTVLGPYEIPTSAFRWRGDWTPGVLYLVNDVFTINGQIYIVIFNHTSNSTFDAGANDGSGHNYYALMLSSPGNSLPTGGAVGQVLTRSDTPDFAVTWGWPLPTGGDTDYILMKDSNTNQDASWRFAPFVWAPPVSPPAVPGYVLTTVDGTSQTTEWLRAATVFADSGGGIASPPASPPMQPGQVYISVDGTPGNTSFADLLPIDINSGTLVSGDQLRWNDSTSNWENRGATVDGPSGSSITIDPYAHPVTYFTPTANSTISQAGGKIGDLFMIRITTSGTTSYNVTFDGSFQSQGVLATGTVNGKTWIITFMSANSGTAWEISRIGPF